MFILCDVRLHCFILCVIKNALKRSPHLYRDIQHPFWNESGFTVQTLTLTKKTKQLAVEPLSRDCKDADRPARIKKGEGGDVWHTVHVWVWKILSYFAVQSKREGKKKDGRWQGKDAGLSSWMWLQTHNYCISSAGRCWNSTVTFSLQSPLLLSTHWDTHTHTHLQWMIAGSHFYIWPQMWMISFFPSLSHTHTHTWREMSVIFFGAHTNICKLTSPYTRAFS